MSILDQEGVTLWKEENRESDDESKISSYLVNRSINFEFIESNVSSHYFDSGETLYLRGLFSTAEHPNAIIALLMGPCVDSQSPNELFICDIIDTIAKSLQTEMELKAALADSESELNAMAAELTERYEELNLVYEADNSVLRGLQSQESLRQLVNNCTEYLNVGMTALSIPDKNITIYDFNDSDHIQHPTSLVGNIMSDCYSALMAHKQTIVINTIQTSLKHNILCEIPQKMIITPILTGEEEVNGTLIIVNNNWKADFTNSDRNLLLVMAKKVSKVIQDTYDDLTGLINKHSFEYNLKDAFSDVHSQGLEHALLNIDIDRLGVINETSCTEAGDMLLRVVASTITNMVRSRDVVARLGGDEFGVLLESCPMETASNVAKNLSQEVADLSYEWQGKQYDISVSIGVVPINAESDSVATILSNSEMARNAAKERGVSQIVIYEQDDIDLLRRRDEIKWVTRIQSALRDGRFQLHSQLIKSFKTDTDDHYEILIRMIDDNGGLVFPDQFLPAAEHFHLMPELDRWVVKHAIDELLNSDAQHRAPPCRLAINLSGQSLCEEGFQEFLHNQVNRMGEFSSMLGFEITESAAIDNIMQARVLIDILKQEGCSFALDDFGTGLSSFAYLQNLDVDYLKIDGSFVRNIAQDPIARTMVSAINQVGQAMGLHTIAEYVENDLIITQLKQIGIDYGQGYGLGRPKPFQQLLSDLSENNLAVVRCAEGS
jgi:diguanylate cyclase (GGDEF)-like protein